MRFRLFATALAMLLFCAACGGGGQLDAPDDTAQLAGSVQAEEAPAGDFGREGRFAVHMRPQTEVDPGLKGTSSLSMQLPALLPLTRRVSDTEYTVGATQYVPELPSNRVEQKGDYLVFRPLWHDKYFDNIADVSYCIYSTDLTGYSGLPTIGFDWAENGNPTIPDKYYIGLSNWDSGRWSWFDGPLDQVLSLDSLDPYTNDNGAMLITVLVIQRETVVVLHDITVGAPELRGTGFEVQDIAISTSVPPLFIPTLPAAVDLTPGCAPINDQGTWGACTCFAVGDGAYNYELNSIYGQLGWDLTDIGNRVSPKYIYVESGKDQGFPPGGDTGRWTDQVAIGMMSFGISTEQNAPYDLIYDDDWSPEALADAQLLRNSSYTALPCRSDAGIESIKAVLAIQQRPVLVSTAVDLGLFYYEPGDVWHFVGPNYGGHAMLIVGYDDARQAFRVRNSWGTDWGDNGYLWMSYGSLKHPLNWFAQCGYITDDYEDAVAQKYTGQTLSILPPAALDASAGSAGTAVALHWDSVPGASGYRVYRDTPANKIADLGLVTDFSDNGLGDELAHTYWVTALDGITESGRSRSALGFVAQKPSISGVSPEGGAEGQRIRFIPQVSGDSGVSFAWDFGGGASPNTSTEAGPNVVLGSEGSYAASLTVTSANGVQTIDWTLEVKLNQPPAAYLDNPDMVPGIAPYDCLLDGTSGDSDGYIVLYEFDWENDGTYDLVTTEPVVHHVYTDVGTHIAKLRVMDDAGLYDTATEQIHVVPENYAPYPEISATPPAGPAPLDVHFDSAGSRDEDGTIEYYEWDFDNDGTVDAEGSTLTETDHQYAAVGNYTALLRVTDNEGATGEITTDISVGLPLIEGWTSHTIRHWDDGASFRLLNAGLVSGNPAVACTTSTKALEYFESTAAIPADPSDWTLSVALAEGGLNKNTQPFGFCDRSGSPFVSYSSGSLSSLKWTGASWLDVNVDSTASCGESSSAAMIAGKPAIAYTYTFNPNSIYYAYAGSADPALPSDWIVTEVDTAGNPDVGTDLELIEIGGLPCIAYGKRDPAPDTQLRLWLARGLTATPGGTADWVLHKVDPAKNTGQDIALASLGGRPAIAYSFADGPLGMRFAWADSADPASAADWTLMTVETGKRGSPSLAVVNGVPLFCYVANSPNGGLTLAQASSATPAGDADWSYQRMFSADISNGVCSLLSVGNQPAIVFGWNAAGSVVYISPAP